MQHSAMGPLAGLKVVEFTGIGPGPHCAMMLSDLGADVLRIDRAGGNGWPNPVADRGRATLVLDLRSEAGIASAMEAVTHADVLIEGFRPGVMERLGLGPEACHARNPGLVFARMTGWGQTGPLSQRAGHDINYIALTGALAAIGKPGEPATVPLNLVGDFGGGSMLMAVGILAALFERERSGKGQVVDAAIVDGVGSLMSFFAGLLPSGAISLDREENLLAGPAPFYRSYLCACGGEVSVGALEPQFFAQLVKQLECPEIAEHQNDRAQWPRIERIFTEIFAQRTRDSWAEIFADSDACVFPVLTLEEAMADPHLRARGSYVDHDGVLQAAPAPHFSRTPGAIRQAHDPEEMLARWASK